jgi:tetratricopeptide (TPR) repeat protein
VSARPFQSPAEGGPPWLEVTTDHFVTWTDLDPSEARRLVERLEWTRSAIVASAWGRIAAPETQLGIVALRPGELTDLSRPGVKGWVIVDAHQPRLVLSAEDGTTPSPAVAYELAQHLSAFALLRQPRWLWEGLAAYLESISPLPGSETALVGLPSRWAGTVRRGPVPARELLAWGERGEGEQRDALHGSAWLLVHYLVSERGRQFAAWQDLLAGGEAPQRAWRRAFPEYDPLAPKGLARLDEDLGAYAREGRFRKRAVPVPRWRGTTIERAMDVAEVYAMRALLQLSVPPASGPPLEVRRAAAREEVAEALRRDPSDALALSLAVWLAPEAERPERARASARAHPGNWRAWYVVARVLQGTAERAEREAALRRALALSAGDPAVLSALAWELVESGRAAEALPLAAEAVERAAWKALPLDAQAAALAGTGDCARALAVQRRAVEVLPDWTPDQERADLNNRLEAYEARCGAGPDQRSGEQGSLDSSPRGP